MADGAPGTEAARGRPVDELRHWDGLLAVGLGTGLAPVAPGTFGTLLGIPLVLALWPLGPLAYALVVLALALLGVWICERAGRRLGEGDHGAIVWDEIIGYAIGLWWITPTWPWLLAGFVVFRGFDILKPWPVSWADRRVGGGVGVMLDDVLAGLYTLAVLQLAGQFL